MLKPALLYKEELTKKFAEHMYDDDFRLYTGYRYCFSLPDLDAKDNNYRYAIVSPTTNDVIGYIAYYIDDTINSAYNFGLFSFDKGNPIVGKDLYDLISKFFSNKTIRRIEWRCIGDNPVAKHYDRICEAFNGNKVTLHKVTKNNENQYVDEYIYEIFNHNFKESGQDD